MNIAIRAPFEPMLSFINNLLSKIPLINISILLKLSAKELNVVGISGLNKQNAIQSEFGAFTKERKKQ